MDDQRMEASLRSKVKTFVKRTPIFFSTSGNVEKLPHAAVARVGLLH
jgi:hypothetical protein